MYRPYPRPYSRPYTRAYPRRVVAQAGFLSPQQARHGYQRVATSAPGYYWSAPYGESHDARAFENTPLAPRMVAYGQNAADAPPAAQQRRAYAGKEEADYEDVEEEEDDENYIPSGEEALNQVRINDTLWTVGALGAFVMGILLLVLVIFAAVGLIRADFPPPALPAYTVWYHTLGAVSFLLCVLWLARIRRLWLLYTSVVVEVVCLLVEIFALIMLIVWIVYHALGLLPAAVEPCDAAMNSFYCLGANGSVIGHYVAFVFVLVIVIVRLIMVVEIATVLSNIIGLGVLRVVARRYGRAGVDRYNPDVQEMAEAGDFDGIDEAPGETARDLEYDEDDDAVGDEAILRSRARRRQRPLGVPRRQRAVPPERYVDVPEAAAATTTTVTADEPVATATPPVPAPETAPAPEPVYQPRAAPPPPVAVSTERDPGQPDGRDAAATALDSASDEEADYGQRISLDSDLALHGGERSRARRTRRTKGVHLF